MATNKRTYPNDYFAWYNDDKRLAIVSIDTTATGTERTSEKYDTFQGEGSGGTITTFANYTSTVSGTTLITSTAHGLATNDRVSVTSSPDSYYDANYAITKVSDDTFYVTKAYSAEDSGTFTPLFIDNGIRLTYHSKYEAITTSSLTSELSTTNGLDTGLQTSLLYYVRARLLEDQGNLQQAQYYRQMFERDVKQYPSRKSGIRALAVPRL